MPVILYHRIDLHGLTKEQALTKLDESLPGWVDIARKVHMIQVRIICGGGNHILAVAVEDWIRRNSRRESAIGEHYK